MVVFGDLRFDFRVYREARALADAGYDVDWHEYPMQHEVCLPEIEAAGAWLRARLATPRSGP